MKTAIALSAFLLASPAFAAAQFCPEASPHAPHDLMIQTLANNWQEKVAETATMRGDDGTIIGMFEITASDGGSWTAIATNSDGISCMMAAGADYSGAKAKPKGTGA